MKLTLKMLSLVLAFTMLTAIFAGCSSSSEATSEETSQATSDTEQTTETHEKGVFVDGEKIDLDPIMTIDGEDVPFDLFRYYYLTNRYYFDYGDTTVWDSEEDDVKEGAASLLSFVEQNLVSGYAIRALAADEGVALTDEEIEEIDTQIESLREQFGGDEAFQQALDAQNYTEEVYRTLFTTSVLMEKMLGEVYGDEIRADVEQNYVHAEHILISFEDSTAEEHATELALAEEILAKLEAGEDFTALRTEYDSDGGQPTEGYYFTTGEMVEPFETAAFALKDNEISGIVETSYGYHILRRLPMDETYINENMLDLLSNSMMELVSADFDARAEKFTITYNKNYELIAPNNIF